MSKKVPMDMIEVLDEVPEMDVPFAKILSPTPDHPVKALILNARPVRVPTHFFEGRTIPHIIERSLCPGCQASRKKAVKVYLGAIEYPANKLALVELTHMAALEWKAKLDDPKFDFRGAMVTVVRAGRNPRGTCRATFQFGHTKIAKLGPPLPVMEILRQIWGGHDAMKKLLDGARADVLEDIPT